jgi:hypothetical protein
MRDNWTLAAEWQQVEGDFIVINPFGPQASRSKVHNWYVSVARRLNDKFEVGTYFDTQKNEFPAAGSPSSANHNYDWALSLKYDLNEHVVIKIEGHTIDGTYNVFNTIRTPNPTLDTRTKYFAVKTTFSF